MPIKTKAIAVIFYIFVVSGCATNSKVTLPDGTPGYSVSCDGTVLSMNACYEKAGQLCSQGYDVQNQTSENGFIFSGNFGSATSMKGLLIKCKAAEVGQTLEQNDFS